MPPPAPPAPAPAPAPAAPPAANPAADQPNIPREGMDSQQAENFSEAFADLDKIGKDDGGPADPPLSPAASKEAERTRDDATGKFKETPKEKAQPAKPQPSQQKPQPTPPKPSATPEPKTPKELREHYDAVKAKHADLEKRYAELEKRSKLPIDDPEKKSLAEKAANYEKKLAEYEQEMRYINYEKSEEYRDKYLKPFEDAWIEGRNNTSALEIKEVRDADNEQVLQPAREATSEDFDRLMQLDDRAFNKEVHKLFDPVSAASIVTDRKLVKRLLNAKNAAVETYRKEGAAREAQQVKARQDEASQHGTAWKQANEEGIAKYPQYFAPDETDPEGNALLEKGFHWADRAFSEGQPLKEGDKPLTPQQLTRLRSALRNKAGGFDRLAHRYDSLKTENEALKEKLAAYENSEPGEGKGKGGGGGGGEVEDDTPTGAFDRQFGAGK